MILFTNYALNDFKAAIRYYLNEALTVYWRNCSFVSWRNNRADYGIGSSPRIKYTKIRDDPRLYHPSFISIHSQ